ncbi:MAG: hypothetical protein GEU80_01130 [Dehalococcoidia bacterium]|nr:hypothetical protein [Dehalococcoidia bacterium]
MQTHSLGYTLVWALVLTVAWFAIAAVLTDTYQESGPVEIGLTALIFFLIIFTTMRLTNRVTLWVGKRMGMEPRGPGNRGRRAAATPAEPAPSTTERPEHAQRRRQRRRRRGSRARHD